MASGGQDRSEESLGLGMGVLPDILRNSVGLRRSYIPSASHRGSRLGVVTLKTKMTKKRDGEAREGLEIPKEGRGGSAETQAGPGYPQENVPDTLLQGTELEQSCWAGKKPDSRGRAEDPSEASPSFLTLTCP